MENEEKTRKAAINSMKASNKPLCIADIILEGKTELSEEGKDYLEEFLRDTEKDKIFT
jgi:hypothetical protein